MTPNNIAPYYYDLHIHSALSPCGDNDMTPNNIVNMALLNELDFMAVCDHNCCFNLPAVIECAKNTNVTVIPGMEVETCEEVHVLTYFPDLASCEKMCGIVMSSLPDIKNNVQIFGHQFVMDAQDNVVRDVENLLSTATSLSIYDVISHAKSLGGVAVPAHINKSSYSVLSNLGFIPPDLEISAVELLKDSKVEEFNNSQFKKYNIISSSDSHYLQDILYKKSSITLPDKTVSALLDKLRG